MKDNIQFVLILCLFGYIIFLQQCEGGRSKTNQDVPKIDTIISMDTIMPTPVIVNLPRQDIPAPIVVYIDSSKSKIVTTDIDTNQHQQVQLYQDSIEDENMKFYYTSLVDGELLTNNFNYKLKIPKQITKTVEITKPFPVPANSFFLNTGVGANSSGIASLALGLQFVSKKGWSIGYDYDIFQNSHQVRLGIRLFSLKN